MTLQMNNANVIIQEVIFQKILSASLGGEPMKLSQIFGIGSQKIISANNSVNGTVTSVKTCWWLKINTKPVRWDYLDGAVFPHIISFTYRVDGTEYRGSRYISWRARCPKVNEAIPVFFNPSDPSKYAVPVP